MILAFSFFAGLQGRRSHSFCNGDASVPRSAPALPPSRRPDFGVPLERGSGRTFPDMPYEEAWRFSATHRYPDITKGPRIWSFANCRASSQCGYRTRQSCIYRSITNNPTWTKHVRLWPKATTRAQQVIIVHPFGGIGNQGQEIIAQKTSGPHMGFSCGSYTSIVIGPDSFPKSGSPVKSGREIIVYMY